MHSPRDRALAWPSTLPHTLYIHAFKTSSTVGRAAADEFCEIARLALMLRIERALHATGLLAAHGSALHATACWR